MNIETHWDRFQECKSECEPKISLTDIEYSKWNSNFVSEVKVNPKFGQVKVVPVRGPEELFFAQVEPGGLISFITKEINI